MLTQTQISLNLRWPWQRSLTPKPQVGSGWFVHQSSKQVSSTRNGVCRSTVTLWAIVYSIPTQNWNDPKKNQSPAAGSYHPQASFPFPMAPSLRFTSVVSFWFSGRFVPTCLFWSQLSGAPRGSGSTRAAQRKRRTGFEGSTGRTWRVFGETRWKEPVFGSWAGNARKGHQLGWIGCFLFFWLFFFPPLPDFLFHFSAETSKFGVCTPVICGWTQKQCNKREPHHQEGRPP